MSLRLTRPERVAILAATTKRITRVEKPDLPDRIVLAYSNPRPYMDKQTGHVFRAEREPSAWIEQLKAVRTAKGLHRITWTLVDNRQVALMPARHHGYTTDPTHAVDRNEAVLSDKDKARLSATARARHVQLREGAAEDRRRQERAVRARLRDALRGLDPQAQAVLLAEVDRTIRELEGAA